MFLTLNWRKNSSNSTNYDGLTDIIEENSSKLQLLPLPFLIAILVTIFLVGFIGNTLVVVIILRKRRMQKYTTNWLILNLAIADLAVSSFCVPLYAPLVLTQTWNYDKVFCSVYYPLGTATLLASVFTLVVLTCTRFWAIRYPFRKQISVYTAKVLIVLIWVFSFTLVLPLITILKYDEDNTVCYEQSNKSCREFYTLCLFLFGYALPLFIITIAYSYIIYELVPKKKPFCGCYRDHRQLKENKNVIKLSFVITITFAMCVLPNQIVWLFHKFGNFAQYKYKNDIRLGTHILLFMNSALNPIVYNVFSTKFRKGLKELCSALCSGCRFENSRTKHSRSSTVRTILANEQQESLVVKSPGTNELKKQDWMTVYEMNVCR